MSSDDVIIDVRDVCTHFGAVVVHDRVSLSVRRGEIFVLAGSSGCGKSTLLREMIMLHRPESGSIRVLGKDVIAADEHEAAWLRRRWGVMFERGALFSALTVLENIGAPLHEHTLLSDAFIDEIAALKIALVGLPADAAAKYPNELSGGMRKRAALARALALDPELVFLDEPSAGLDPLSATGLDELVKNLQALLGLTVMVISHDLDLMWRVADRVAILGEGRVLGLGTMDELSRETHPMVREYFHGPRGRAAREQVWTQK